MASAPHHPGVKHYFYYGPRRPSLNRPVVRGGLFSNRRRLPSADTPPPKPIAIDFRDWDSSSTSSRPFPQTSSTPPPPTSVPSAARRLSPITRFVLDSLLRHRRWCPQLLHDLSKLRRLPPSLVAEVLRHLPSRPADGRVHPSLPSRFFMWASRQKGYRPSFASFNALTYTLLRSRVPLPPDHIPNLMLSLGKAPSEKQLEILVRHHAETSSPLRLFHAYRTIRSQFGIKPRVFLYNRILEALVRARRLDLALTVYEDFKADGLKEEAITFTILAKGLCRDGRVDDALELLDQMRKELCRPDVFAYTAMVKALAAEGDMDGCLKVWDVMKKDKVKPDVMAYTTLIAGLCKVGKVGKGLECFREMKDKKVLIDRAVYRSLVEGFVTKGKVGAGLDLLKEMVHDGYRADLGIYDCLISGLCGAGRADKAYKLFLYVVQEGLVPGFQTASPLLASYAELNDMDSFFLLVDKLGELRLPVLDHLSKFFSFFMEKEGRELKGLEVFEAVKAEGYRSVDIYNIFIKCLYKIKETKKALSLFKEMKGSKEFEPDSCTYSLIIPCFVDVGDVREACSCYNKMREISWTPSIAAYCSLVKGVCKIGEVNAAMTLVKDCLGNITNGPMEFKYTLNVLNACRSGKPEKVIEVLDEMIELGYPLEDVIYCATIHGFCKYASSGEARKVFAVMRDRNMLTEANLIVFEEFLNEHLKRTTASLVISGLKFFGLESKLQLTSRAD